MANKKTKKARKKGWAILEFPFSFVVFQISCSWLSNLFLLYMLLPQLCSLFPAIADAFADAIRKDADVIYAAINDWSCVFLAFISFLPIQYLMEDRRDAFILATDGKISRKGGIIWHIENYGKYDLLATLCIIGVTLIDWFGLPNFSFSFDALYDTIGVWLGIPTVLLILVAAQFLSVLFAQSRWRCKHFLEI